MLIRVFISCMCISSTLQGLLRSRQDFLVFDVLNCMSILLWPFLLPIYKCCISGSSSNAECKTVDMLSKYAGSRVGVSLSRILPLPTRSCYLRLKKCSIFVNPMSISAFMNC